MAYLYAVLSAVVIILCVWVIYLTLRIREFQRVQTLLMQGEEIDLSKLIKSFAEEEEKLRSNLKELGKEHNRVAETLRGAIQKMGVVRFDAFEDMGGKLSFAAAFLNEHGDGVVVSAINGRNESCTYAKPIRNGSSIYNLSKEEEEAIDKALSYQPASTN